MKSFRVPFIGWSIRRRVVGPGWVIQKDNGLIYHSYGSLWHALAFAWRGLKGERQWEK